MVNMNAIDDMVKDGYTYLPAAIQEMKHRMNIYSISFLGFRIKKVIFNNPATIVFWTDSTKTVVKAENEPFDREKGLAMAIAKKALGNRGNYYNEFKKWIDYEDAD